MDIRQLKSIQRAIIFLTILCGLGIAASFAFLITPSPPLEPALPKEGKTSYALRQAVNRERGAAGLPELKPHVSLAEAALAHSIDQARHDNLDHYGSDKSTWADRCSRAGYPGASLATIGEIVAEWQVTPEQAIADWMQSPGHKAAILDKRWQHCGGGMAESSAGRRYWTVDFGFIKD